MPLPDKVAQDQQFSVEPTSADEFATEWSAAVGDSS